MPEVPPDWKPVAFKEWQVVCDALESGEQSIILRKGGISEGKGGFQWLHQRFFLFPTFYHGQAAQVRPDGRGEPRQFRPPRAGGAEIEIRLFAELLAADRISCWEEAAALSPEHIWTEETIRERFAWDGEAPGIGLARLKVHRLPVPWVLRDRKAFGGCRSWIGLPAPEHPDLRGLIASAEPV